MTKTNIVLTLVILFMGASDLFGQERPEWIGQFEKTIKAKEPQWKVAKGHINAAPDHYGESFRLTRAGVSGGIQISAYTILTNPDETFQGLVTIKDNLTKRATKTKLSGIGDEAYMWASRDPNAHATVFFKKGKTYVTVFLPGKAAAQRFAKYAADLIP